MSCSRNARNRRPSKQLLDTRRRALERRAGRTAPGRRPRGDREDRRNDVISLRARDAQQVLEPVSDTRERRWPATLRLVREDQEGPPGRRRTTWETGSQEPSAHGISAGKFFSRPGESNDRRAMDRPASSSVPSCRSGRYSLRARRGPRRLQSAEQQAKKALEDSRRQAESIQRAAALEGREEALKLRQQAEREVQESRATQLAAESVIRERELALDAASELVEKKERDVRRQEQDLAKREGGQHPGGGAPGLLETRADRRLGAVAGLSAEGGPANQLVATIGERGPRRGGAPHVRDARERPAQRRARGAGRSSPPPSSVNRGRPGFGVHRVGGAPADDDMKGRIISARGATSARSRTITGVDVIIDDTTEAVIPLASTRFGAKIARQSLERLVADGRIHPARIQEIVVKVKASGRQDPRAGGRWRAWR